MDEYQLVLTKLRPHLNELQWRLLLGAHAQALGRGGISRVAALTGSHPDTVSRGARELEQGIDASGRVRRAGAGRKRVEEADPRLVDELKALVSWRASGDPAHPLLWTTKSTRHLSVALSQQGWLVGADTVGRLLKENLGFTLRGNTTATEFRQSQETQFRYINDLAAWCLAAAIPLISVSYRKKEAIAPGDWTSAGADVQTAAFAVESIQRWWQRIGVAAFPGARQILITANCAVSHDDKRRVWELGLARLAAGLRIEITVVHFPPGAWKWDHVEHRLSSAVSMDWRGHGMESHEATVATIRADLAHQGHTAEVKLHSVGHPTMTEISDTQSGQADQRVVRPHELNGDWNYSFIVDGSGVDGAPAAIT